MGSELTPGPSFSITSTFDLPFDMHLQWQEDIYLATLKTVTKLKGKQFFSSSPILNRLTWHFGRQLP